MSWQYLIASVQQSRVTFVNGEWHGEIGLETTTDSKARIDSCPKTWTWLDQVGAEGWELVSVSAAAHDGAVLETLFLRRPNNTPV